MAGMGARKNSTHSTKDTVKITETINILKISPRFPKNHTITFFFTEGLAEKEDKRTST